MSRRPDGAILRRLAGRRHATASRPSRRPPWPRARRSKAAYFVPRLCHAVRGLARAPQVCPVCATYRTDDGVILVDPQRCIGCGYCVVACPYGARYLVPAGRRRPNDMPGVADKCTWCYHRISRGGMVPACVEVCPVGARRFGDAQRPRQRDRDASSASAAEDAPTPSTAPGRACSTSAPSIDGGLSHGRPHPPPRHPRRAAHPARPARDRPGRARRGPRRCRRPSGCGSAGCSRSWPSPPSPRSSPCRPGWEVFGTSPEFEWGLLIIGYVFFAIMTCGLCLASSLGTVFGIDRFRPAREAPRDPRACCRCRRAFGIIALDLHYPIRLVFGAVLSPRPPRRCGGWACSTALPRRPAGRGVEHVLAPSGIHQ